MTKRRILLWTILYFALSSYALSVPVLAGEPPTEPMLRIEAGMHTAGIIRIGLDQNDRYLATASHDKTVRIWELATGRLIKILRLPIGDGMEGLLNAVAVSPDGRLIAAGGETGFQWEGKKFVYLFDFETGAMVHRLASSSGIIHLAFSKDGQFLAKTGADLQVFRVSDGTVVMEDKYGRNTPGADFDSSGRLVVVCYDGLIRLYDPNFKLIAKWQTASENEPYSARFSPDGSKIAVGYKKAVRVDVLSSHDLTKLYSPDTSGIDSHGSLAAVSWSSDGHYLYAGGAQQVSGITGIGLLRKWADGGKGTYSDLDPRGYGIRSIVSMKDGSIAYGTYDPAIGAFDQTDRKTFYIGPPTIDPRGLKRRFLISRDGAKILFSLDNVGKATAQFSLGNRLFEQDPPIDTNLLAPITAVEGFPKPEERRAFAVSPDRETILQETGHSLDLRDRSGKVRWSVPYHAPVTALNISGSGIVAAAGFTDGTIRWYRMTDGKQLLAFFPHNDRKRWVMWTPSGYYDASPGAEDLIGWHVNRGKDQVADFFPVGQFRNTYYRPDVIAKVLETLDESEAVRLANEAGGRKAQTVALTQQLPPVVTILSPQDGTEVSTADVLVRVSVRSSSPVTGLKTLVDGRPVANERGVKVEAGVADGSIREIRVTLPSRDAEIAIIAENQFTVSVPAMVRLKWKGTAPSDEFVIKPKLYVLSVGVSKYQLKDLTLGLAAKDAQDFAASLKGQQGGLYREVVTKVLADAQATRDEVLDGLEWLQKQTTSKDVAMVFLAGHGVNDPNGIYYFLPVNADPEKLKRTGIAFSDIKNTISTLAGKTLAFVDTCHSGNVMGTRRGVADITAVVNELASAESGAVVFASSTGNQFSLEDPAWGNGAFTKALVEGLSGKADYTGKGKISINMLDLYLSERVKELTGGKQTPTTTKPQTIQDFPVAVRK